MAILRVSDDFAKWLKELYNEEKAKNPAFRNSSFVKFTDSLPNKGRPERFFIDGSLRNTKRPFL